MSKEHDHTVLGVVEIPVSLTVKAKNEKEALEKATKLINCYNALLKELTIPNASGTVHTLTVNDFDIIWERAERDCSEEEQSDEE